MKALILAGGSGTRLWPYSRNNYPKQFLKLHSGKSLLQTTVERLLPKITLNDIVVMTNNDYKFYVDADLSSYNNAKSEDNEFHIVLEPFARNTAPAIALGAKFCLEQGCDENEVIFITPSDHLIEPHDEFLKYLNKAEEIAKKGYIVTFGMKPDKPETGFGYIKAEKNNNKNNDGFQKVERFVEKPDYETAESYLKEGNYLWNSGMFAFSIKTILEEFEKYSPEIASFNKLSLHDAIEAFEKLPNISIDYSIMEQSSKVVTIPMNLRWNDIGAWDAVYEVMEKDSNGNAIVGDVVSIDSKNSLIMGSKRLVTTIGMEDCLIAETGDAILVAKKGHTQKVKTLINGLKKEKRIEATEHLTTYRPWGNYTILDEGERYKIKRIVVKPNEKLSLQIHHHRSEHWVVVKGSARVTIGEQISCIHENESVFVPKLTRHRLENPGKIPLELIEVQNGEYVGEDDIERFDDKYGRDTQ